MGANGVRSFMWGSEGSLGSGATYDSLGFFRESSLHMNPWVFPRAIATYESRGLLRRLQLPLGFLRQLKLISTMGMCIMPPKTTYSTYLYFPKLFVHVGVGSEKAKPPTLRTLRTLRTCFGNCLHLGVRRVRRVRNASPRNSTYFTYSTYLFS